MTVEKIAEKVLVLIETLYPQFKKPLHLHQVNAEHSLKEVTEAIQTGQVASNGSFTQILESELSRFFKGHHVVCVNSGTSALHLALILNNVGNDDLVVTTPFTFVATSNAISYTGAAPLFLDISLDNYGLCPQRLKEFLEKETHLVGSDRVHNQSGRRIAACLPVHAFGIPCHIDKIVEICNAHGLPVIEDAAEAFGSELNGKLVGTFGESGIISFNGNKVLTAGGGGCIVTSSESMANQARHLSQQAKQHNTYAFHHDQVGFNYRMPSLNAAYLLGQLRHTKEILKKKRDLATLYRQLADQLGLEMIVPPANTNTNGWLNCIKLENATQRDEVLSFLYAHEIHARQAWKPMSLLPMYEHCISGSLTNAMQAYNTIVCLPSVTS